MGTRLNLKTPRDYLLHRDVCSYGYFLLAPNAWDPQRRTFTRPLDLDDGPATLTLTQTPGRRGSPIRAMADRALTRREQTTARRLFTRMLRLDDEGVAEFLRLDPRWRRSGRGRLFRSPTFFEDLVKTVTSCNVTWAGTVRMNRRLCEVVNPAFPRPAQLARRRPETLRSRCSVGYRDVRLVALAKLFRSGEVDPRWFEDPAVSDDDIHSALLELPGVGPYAAANAMHLLGRYTRLPIDTEGVKHGRTVLGMKGSTRSIERQLHAHYERFGDHRFRSYWFEMLETYERTNGPAWTWPGDQKF